MHEPIRCDGPCVQHEKHRNQSHLDSVLVLPFMLLCRRGKQTETTEDFASFMAMFSWNDLATDHTFQKLMTVQIHQVKTQIYLKVIIPSPGWDRVKV